MGAVQKSDIEKLKGYAEKGKKGVETLQEYIKAAKELEEAGKTISDFQKIAMKLTFLGKAGTALQVVSIGLAIVMVFMDEESFEEKTLKGIDEIIERVRGLQQTVELGFDRLETIAKIQSERIALELARDRVEAAINVLSKVTRAQQVGPVSKEIMDELVAFGTDDLRTALRTFSNALTGSSLGEPILDLYAKLNYGSAGETTVVGTYLLQTAQSCVVALTAIETERLRRNLAREVADGSLSQTDRKAEQARRTVQLLDSLDDEFSSDLEGLADIVSHAISLSLDPIETRRHVARYYTDHQQEFLFKDGSFQASANKIIAKYTQVWPYLDFAVVVSETLDDSRRHLVAHPAENLFQDNKDKNCAVMWWPRFANKPSTIRDWPKLIPTLPQDQWIKPSRAELATCNDTHGGAPDFVSQDPAVAADRTSVTIELFSKINTV